MNAILSVRDRLRSDRAVFGVLAPLLKLFVVSTRDSVGNVRALPRLGLGPAEESSLDGSWKPGGLFKSCCWPDRQGLRGEGRMNTSGGVVMKLHCLSVQIDSPASCEEEEVKACQPTELVVVFRAIRDTETVT